MNNLYLDCEFNGFQGELISMALVAENDVYWYEVVPCSNPIPWVKDNVMPVLNKEPISLKELSLSLEYFLSRYSTVNIIADWPEDIAHFCTALVVGQGVTITKPKITFEICKSINNNSNIPHNALEDARALKKYA